MLNRMLRKRIKLTAMLFGWVEKGFTVIFADFVIVNVLGSIRIVLDQNCAIL